MIGRWKRALAVLCAALICFPWARGLAEFSPGYSKISAGEGATLRLTGELTSLEGLGKQSLEIVNGWLSGLEISATAGKHTRADVTMNGSSLFSAYVKRENGYTLTTFLPSGSAYLTDPTGPDALELLTDGKTIPDVTMLPGLYAAVSPSLYGALEQHVTPKTVKEPTSIKNAAAAASYVNYLFKNGQLNEAWEDVLNAVLPSLRRAMADQPALYAQAEELLSSLAFSGECRFKRFLDKEGNELGMQFTGQAAKGDDQRKVTLFGGYTPDKGGYVSLTLAGVGSKNSLKMNFGAKLTAKNAARTLTMEGTYTQVQDGATTAYTVEGTLKNTVKEDNEHWTGKITLTATENKVKTTWTLSPDMNFGADGLRGDIAVQRKTGSKVTLKATLHAVLAEAGNESAPNANSAKDLRSMTAEAARAVVMEQLVPLTGTVAGLVSALPENERTLLMHELRTDAWMNGPAVPAAAVTAIPQVTQEPAGSWVVEEDDGQ